MKATFPVTTKSGEKLIEYIRREIAKADHDGFNAKNVRIFGKLLEDSEIIWVFSLQLDSLSMWWPTASTTSIQNLSAKRNPTS
jgi:hypothetical protein